MSRLPGAGDTRERLPVNTLAAGSTWLRVASTRHDTPLYFDSQPGSRFNAHSRRFGTLYCAQTVFIHPGTIRTAIAWLCSSARDAASGMTWYQS